MGFTTDGTDLKNDAAASISYSTAVAKRKDSMFEHTRANDSAPPRKRTERPIGQGPAPSPGHSKTPTETLSHKAGSTSMISRKELSLVQRPVRNAQTSTPNAPAPSSDIQLQPQPSQTQVIMICLATCSEPKLVALHQISMMNPPARNYDLFVRLWEAYKVNRQHLTLWKLRIPPFWKRVTAIHFVHFRVHLPVPTRVEITDMHSLPDGAPGWVCGYETHQSMSETIMAYYLYHPSEIGDDFRWSTYEWIPRKNGPLQPRREKLGWGLYFEESWRRDVICWSAATILFGGYLIRILVGVGKGDMSFGMTVSANNIALLASVVSTMGLVHTLRK